jgi:hypothetical protein
MKKFTWKALLFIIVLSLFLSISGCNLPGMTTTDPGLEATRIALGIESTMLVIQQQTLEAQLNAPTEMPTYTPYPTYTPELPKEEPAAEPPAAEPLQVEAQPTATVDMQERIRSANILIYEDLRGDPVLLPYVHETVNRMGFSGGKIVEVNDAVGNFKDQLLSSTKWDLIIVASEARGSIRGEFWEYILTQVNNDVGLIVEMWYLDDTANGKVDGILAKCGVSFQKDWNYGVGGNPLDYSIYILDPNHDVVNKPNSGISLSNPSYFYWNPGDVGDLVRLRSSGDATMIAGLYPNEKSNYGVLASCLEGRMILQTFDTHDFDPAMTKALWENYITYTLTNHFKKIDQ